MIEFIGVGRNHCWDLLPLIIRIQIEAEIHVGWNFELEFRIDGNFVLHEQWGIIGHQFRIEFVIRIASIRKDTERRVISGISDPQKLNFVLSFHIRIKQLVLFLIFNRVDGRTIFVSDAVLLEPVSQIFPIRAAVTGLCLFDGCITQIDHLRW